MSARVQRDDPRLLVEEIEYLGETGNVLAHFAMPKGDEKLPGVIVIQEIWGLVPHIEDVTRQLFITLRHSEMRENFSRFTKILDVLHKQSRIISFNTSAHLKSPIIVQKSSHINSLMCPRLSARSSYMAWNTWT